MCDSFLYEGSYFLLVLYEDANDAIDFKLFVYTRGFVCVRLAVRASMWISSIILVTYCTPCHPLQ